MEFSAMTLNMFFPDYDGLDEDEKIIDLAVEQSIWIAGLGYHVWYTDHHFRGPWHSNPLQFAAYVAPQIPADRYLGFGVLSVPFYHPVRLVESMNLLDQLTKGRVLFGVGSGWRGVEPDGLGVDADYHASGRAGEETLDVMQRLWAYRNGDPEYTFEVGANRGKIRRRIMPASYTRPHPIVIRTASRISGLKSAARRGWPAFLGIFGEDLGEQTRVYREALAEANHPADVLETCLRWCTHDCLSMVVAKTDEQAREFEKQANAEQMSIRTRFIERFGSLFGPVMKPQPGQSVPAAFAAGKDMEQAVVGSPDTIAKKIQELVDAGINHVLLRFIGEWAGETRHISENSMRLFADEVMPRFAHVRPMPASVALGRNVAAAGHCWW